MKTVNGFRCGRCNKRWIGEADACPVCGGAVTVCFMKTREQSKAIGFLRDGAVKSVLFYFAIMKVVFYGTFQLFGDLLRIAVKGHEKHKGVVVFLRCILAGVFICVPFTASVGTVDAPISRALFLGVVSGVFLGTFLTLLFAPGIVANRKQSPMAPIISVMGWAPAVISFIVSFCVRDGDIAGTVQLIAFLCWLGALIAAFAANGGARVKCPSCAEMIMREAIRCRFCGVEFSRTTTESNTDVFQAVG